MTDPVELLRRLQVSLVSGYMPADVARWLSLGVDAYLTGQPLEAALYLKTAPGKPSPAAQIRLEQRDEIIRRLARQMDGGTWTVAGQLVRAVEDWQRYRQTNTPPPVTIAGWRLRYFMEAERLALEIPASHSQLYKILTGRRD